MDTTAKIKVPDIDQATYINAPVQKVYETLTTASGWNAWFTRETTLDPIVGGEFVLRWRNWSTKHIDFDAVCEIIEMVPHRVFKFRWPSRHLTTTVTFTLTPCADGTLLAVTESGYDASQDGLAGLVECAGGWGEAITLLKVYLEHGITYGAVPG